MAAISSGPGGLDKAWGNASQTAVLQACWHLVKVGAWLEESLPPNIRKTRGKGGMVRINQEEKKHNRGCEQQQSLHRSLKRAHDMDVFCQARHLPTCRLPPIRYLSLQKPSPLSFLHLENNLLISCPIFLSPATSSRELSLLPSPHHPQANQYPHRPYKAARTTEVRSTASKNQPV